VHFLKPEHFLSGSIFYGGDGQRLPNKNGVLLAVEVYCEDPQYWKLDSYQFKTSGTCEAESQPPAGLLFCARKGRIGRNFLRYQGCAQSEHPRAHLDAKRCAAEK